MHKSFLVFSVHVEDLLFTGLTIDSVGGMVGLCIIVAAFTFLYETVKTLRQKLASSLGRSSCESVQNQSERAMLVEITESHSKLRIHGLHALLYMLQVTMGYLLMLIIMSYNAYLAITVFAAAGLSYYFFSTFIMQRPMVVPIEILSPEEFQQ